MSLEVDILKRWKGFTLQVQFSSGGAPLGILGASGCGKSMTLKCIAGLVCPDEGRIVLNGRVLFDSAARINLKPQQRRIGYLFQNYALFPHMTVEQNLLCALAGGRAQKQAEAAGLLAQFHLQGLEKRYPAQLSGGQQQRVALARILACRPAALLLDEPFSALDAHLKETMQLEMRQLLRGYEGDAIMVTHNRDEVYKLSQNLLFLQAGRALAYGDTKELFKNPCYLEAARLTGCKNFSRARKTGENQVEALDWGVRLQVQPPIPASLTHIGVRAHFLVPATGASQNAIPVQLVEHAEGPFEQNFLFQSRLAPTQEEGCIWVKTAKEPATRALPEYLAVQPADVLLLEDHIPAGKERNEHGTQTHPF